MLLHERATKIWGFLAKPCGWPTAGKLLRQRFHDKIGLSFQSLPCILSRSRAIMAHAINGS